MSVPIDARIAALADRQHGNVTTAQLMRLGLNRSQISDRVRLGRLHRVHQGVYGVGRPPKTALERAAAAVLACGEEAALSHRAGLALWGYGTWPRVMHVTVPGNRSHPGIIVHRATRLLGRDRRRHQGIRATSPARTVLDCAPTLTDKALARAVNELRRAKHLRLQDLEDIIARFPTHPGAKRLKPLLTIKGGPTRSEWEDAFPAFCTQFGLPEPVLSTWVAGYEADAVFPDEKIVIELDSVEFHSDPDAFESDRDRDVDRLVAGFVTVRITWKRIKYRSEREAARLHELIRQRRAQAS